MQLPAFRHLLSTLGYHAAAEKLVFRRDSDCTAHAAAWLVWAQSPSRLPSLREVVGSSVPTSILDRDK